VGAGLKLARQPHELGFDLAAVDEKRLWIVVETNLCVYSGSKSSGVRLTISSTRQ
jgi:hypothetical protein